MEPELSQRSEEEPPMSTPSPTNGRTTVLTITRVLVLFLYGFLVLTEIVLVLAFFLRLFAASTSASFTQWVYQAAGRALEPFRGIFPTLKGESGSVLDLSILFAMLMYGIFALAVHALIEWIDRRIAATRYRAALEASAAQHHPTPPSGRHEVQSGRDPLG
jgi:uncharacterized protein YggT (Ycf19 family)